LISRPYRPRPHRRDPPRRAESVSGGRRSDPGKNVPLQRSGFSLPPVSQCLCPRRCGTGGHGPRRAGGL